jgi:hypothetical protein
MPSILFEISGGWLFKRRRPLPLIIKVGKSGLSIVVGIPIIW